MKRKKGFVLIAICLLGAAILGSVFTNDGESNDNYDTAYYVEGSNNAFIALAKALDKCCYYLVDTAVMSITNLFNSILKN